MPHASRSLRYKLQAAPGLLQDTVVVTPVSWGGVHKSPRFREARRRWIYVDSDR